MIMLCYRDAVEWRRENDSLNVILRMIQLRRFSSPLFWDSHFVCKCFLHFALRTFCFHRAATSNRNVKQTKYSRFRFGDGIKRFSFHEIIFWHYSRQVYCCVCSLFQFVNHTRNEICFKLHLNHLFIDIIYLNRRLCQRNQISRHTSTTRFI